MNEEAKEKELTVEFLMNQLAVEDCNTQHKFLSQLNSSSSMNLLHMTIDRTREEQQTKAHQWKECGTE